MPKYREFSLEEKINFGKQFSKRDKFMYQKGKRNGWLNCFHKDKTRNQSSNFKTRKYSKTNLDSVYADLNKIKIN